MIKNGELDLLKLKPDLNAPVKHMYFLIITPLDYNAKIMIETLQKTAEKRKKAYDLRTCLRKDDIEKNFQPTYLPALVLHDGYAQFSKLDNVSVPVDDQIKGLCRVYNVPEWSFSDYVDSMGYLSHDSDAASRQKLAEDLELILKQKGII
jgi:hypothetical protein